MFWQGSGCLAEKHICVVLEVSWQLRFLRYLRGIDPIEYRSCSLANFVILLTGLVVASGPISVSSSDKVVLKFRQGR